MRLLSTRVIEMTDGWIALAKSAPHEDGRRGSLEGVDCEVNLLYLAETNKISQSTIDTFLHYASIPHSAMTYAQQADFCNVYAFIQRMFIDSAMLDEQSFYDWWNDITN